MDMRVAPAERRQVHIIDGRLTRDAAISAAAPMV
jgi:hypothetical protein